MPTPIATILARAGISPTTLTTQPRLSSAAMGTTPTATILARAGVSPRPRPSLARSITSSSAGRRPITHEVVARYIEDYKPPTTPNTQITRPLNVPYLYEPQIGPPSPQMMNDIAAFTEAEEELRDSLGVGFDAPRSLWEQAKGALWDFAQSPVYLGRLGISSALGPAQMLQDLVDPGQGSEFAGDDNPWYEEYFKDHTALVKGTRQGLEDIGRLAGGFDLTLSNPQAQRDRDYTQDRYATAIREGRIIDELVKDVGTVSLVSGVGSSILGRAPGLRPRASSALFREGGSGPAISTVVPRGPRLLNTTAPVTTRAGSQARISLSAPPKMLSYQVGGMTRTVPLSEVLQPAPSLTSQVLSGRRYVPSRNYRLARYVEMDRGAGVAGILGRAGATGAAAQVGAAGEALSRFSYLSDWADPSMALWRSTTRAGRKVAQRVLGANRVQQIADNLDTRTQDLQDTGLVVSTLRNVMLGMESRDMWAAISEQRSAAERMTNNVAAYAQRAGLSEGQQRMVMFKISGAYTDALETANKLRQSHGPEVAQAFLDTWHDASRFEGVSDRMRLTMDDVDNYSAYRMAGRGSMTKDQIAAINRAVDALGQVRADQTQRAVAAGTLNTEQLMVPRLVEVLDDGRELSSLPPRSQQAARDAGIVREELRDAQMTQPLERIRTRLAEQIMAVQEKIDSRAPEVTSARKEAEIRGTVAEATRAPRREALEHEDPSLRKAYWMATSDEARRLDAEYQSAQAELITARAEYDQLNESIKKSGDPRLPQDQRSQDLREQIAVLEAQVARLDEARAIRSDAEGPTPNAADMHQADAVATLTDEMRAAMGEVGKVGLFQINRVAGLPPVTTHLQGRDYGQGDYQRAGVIGGDGELADWAETVRSQLGGRYEQMTDAQILSEYLDFADDLIDSQTLGIGEMTDLINEIAGFAQLDPQIVKLALGGRGEWEANVSTLLTQAVEDIRDMVVNELLPEGAEGFSQLELAERFNDPEAVVDAGTRLYETFDQIMSEYGLAQAGEVLRKAFNRLSPDEAAQWLSGGPTPTIIEDAFTNADLLSPEQMARIDQGVRTLRDQRRAVIGAQRDTVQSPDMEATRERSIEETVEAFNQRLRLTHEQKVGIPEKPAPTISAENLPTLAAVRRRAKEMRDQWIANEGTAIRSQFAGGIGLAPPYGLSRELGPTWAPYRTIQRLTREGWLGNQEIGGMAPDVWAQALSARIGRDMDIEEAANYMVSEAQRYWDGTSATNQERMADLAAEFGVPIEVVEAAITGTRDSVSEAMGVSSRHLASVAWDAVKAMTPQMQTRLRLANEQGGITPDQWRQAVTDALYQDGMVGDATALDGAGFNWQEMGDWLADQIRIAQGRTSETVPIPEPAGTVGLEQRRAVLADQMERELPGVARIAEMARASAKDASIAEALERGRYQQVLQEGAAQLWDRPAGGGLSPGEQALFEWGQMEERARRLTARQQQLKDKLRSLEWEYNNLDEILERSQQDNIKKVRQNGRSDVVLAIRNSVTRRRLGRITSVEDELDTGATRRRIKIDGVIGQLAIRLNLYGTMVDLIRMSNYDFRPKTPGQLEDFGGLMGDANDTLAFFYSALSKTKRWDELTDDMRRELAEAIIADDLEAIVHAAPDTVVGMRAMYETLIGRIERVWKERPQADLDAQHVGPINPQEMAVLLGNKHIEAIDEAFATFYRREARQLGIYNDAAMSVLPARFRRVLVNNRHVLRAEVQMIDQEWQKMIDARKRGDDAAADTHRELAMYLSQSLEAVPTSIRQFLKAGRPTPTHIIGGPGLDVRETPMMLSSDKVGRGRYRMVPRTRSEQAMRGGLIEPDLGSYLRLQASEATKLMVGQVLRNITMESRWSRDVMELVADDLADWRVGRENQWPTLLQFAKWAEAKGYRIVTNTNLDPRMGPAGTIIDIPTAAQDASGMVPRDWMMAVDATQDARLAEGLRFERGMRAIPTKMADEMDRWTKPSRSRAGAAWDQVTQIWKSMVLPLRIAWWTNNLIGNAVMASITGAMSPAEMARAFGRGMGAERAHLEAEFGKPFTTRQAIKSIWDLGGMPATIPGRLGAHNLVRNEWDHALLSGSIDTRLGRAVATLTDPEYQRLKGEQRNYSDTRKFLGSRWAELVNFGYKFNEFVDNMWRMIVYYGQLDKRMPKIDPADLDGNLLFEGSKYDDAVMTAIEDATKATLNIQGDYSRLTYFERAWVKRFLPFYPWLRHQMSISMRLPIGSPLRAASLGMIVNVMQEDYEQGDLWRQFFGKSLPLPGGYRINVASAVPYTSPLEHPFSPTSGTEMTRSLNPWLAQPVSAITNLDIAQGSTGSRPAEQRMMDAYGNLVNENVFTADKGPLGRLGEIGFRLSEMTPQTALARDVALSQIPGTGFAGEGSRSLTSSVSDSGDVMPYPGTGTWWNRTAQGLGIPFVPSNTREQEERVKIADMVNRARRAANR